MRRLRTLSYLYRLSFCFTVHKLKKITLFRSVEGVHSRNYIFRFVIHGCDSWKTSSLGSQYPVVKLFESERVASFYILYAFVRFKNYHARLLFPRESTWEREKYKFTNIRWQENLEELLGSRQCSISPSLLYDWVELEIRCKVYRIILGRRNVCNRGWVQCLCFLMHAEWRYIGNSLFSHSARTLLKAGYLK